MSGTQVCTKCATSKSIEEFYRDLRKEFGYMTRCKECMRAANRAWVAANKERRAEYDRERRAADPERFREQDRQRAAANPEKRKALWKKWYAGNAEHKKEYDRAYGKANRERKREVHRAWAEDNRERRNKYMRELRRANPEAVRATRRRRRAREKGATVGTIDGEALWELQQGICPLCGSPIDERLSHPNPLSKSLDHIIPLAKGGAHSQANVQWTHLRCNIRKRDRIVEPVVTFHG